MLDCAPYGGKELTDNLEKLAKVQAKFNNDAKIKAFGYNDISTFKYLWNRYVGKPFSPKNVSISSSDIGKYEAGLHEFKANIGKKQNSLSQFFKVAEGNH